MTITRARFSSQRAPCGHDEDGEHAEFWDNEGAGTDQTLFACGCKATREVYHDGSVERTVVRHDGKLLSHETLAEHGA